MEIRADNFMHAYHWSTKYLRPDTDIVGHFAGAIWLNQPDQMSRVIESYGGVHFYK
jgi:hypothetical protein